MFSRLSVSLSLFQSLSLCLSRVLLILVSLSLYPSCFLYPSPSSLTFRIQMLCFLPFPGPVFFYFYFFLPLSHLLLHIYLCFLLHLGFLALFTPETSPVRPSRNLPGKSSIFRCLGALWSITEGNITKPGGTNEGLHDKVRFSTAYTLCSDYTRLLLHSGVCF